MHFSVYFIFMVLLSCNPIEISRQSEDLNSDPKEEVETVKRLISQLYEHFFKVSWAQGTGGGVSIRVGGPDKDRSWRAFVAQSGLQKESSTCDDMLHVA